MYSILLGLLVTTMSAANELRTHSSEREQILQREAELCLGGNLQLTENEELANRLLMRLKLEEVNDGFLHPDAYNFSHHYFTYKNKIPESKLYQIVQKMPKGAALHVHDTALLGPDYLIGLTYLDHLYVCFDGDSVHLQFSDKLPEKKCAANWLLMKQAREASGNTKKFDQELRRHFTIVIDHPETVDTDINVVWTRLSNVFITITPMLCYRPVWEQYFYDALAAFRADNIMYMEVRSTLPPLYELDGTVHDSVETARVYKLTLDRFMKDHPDFVGAKIIYAPLRRVDYSVVEEYIKVARRLKAEFGDLVAGFDLVGQEDLGKPLREFLPLLTAAKSDLTYFFHAGETNWWGTTSDENLLDAVLLGTRRLGHAYALLKHPVLTQMVQERQIGIEVNVLSNQVLGLVNDVRNHPLAQLLARDLPVVVSSDDPGLWEATPLSHDLYVVLVGVANRHAGLRTLKQLALNSLQYSALQEPHKERALELFHQRWDNFVQHLIEHEISKDNTDDVVEIKLLDKDSQR